MARSPLTPDPNHFSLFGASDLSSWLSNVGSDISSDFDKTVGRGADAGWKWTKHAAEAGYHDVAKGAQEGYQWAKTHPEDMYRYGSLAAAGIASVYGGPSAGMAVEDASRTLGPVFFGDYNGVQSHASPDSPADRQQTITNNVYSGGYEPSYAGGTGFVGGGPSGFKGV